MKKENLQILIGVGSVVIVGAGVLWFLHSRGKIDLGIPSFTDSVKESLLDKLSAHNRAEVMRLHPNARKKFAEFINKVESKGYKVLITSGYRTFEKQAQLKRENSNNAAAGYSNHNYGYALDINIYDPKTGKQLLKKASSKGAWQDSGIVKIAKDMGFDWGGDFKTYHDPIHFFIPRDNSTTEMKKLVDAGKVDKEGYVLAFSGVSKKPSLEFELPNELAA